MLDRSEVLTLTRGKGIKVQSGRYEYLALVCEDVHEEYERLRLVSENSSLVRPKLANYGKTWSITQVF